MRALRRFRGAVVVSGLLVAAASPVGAQWTSSPVGAEGSSPPLLAASVRLDAAAPQPGEHVVVDREVGGWAQAPEVVQAVSLYVVPAGVLLDTSVDLPVASMPVPITVGAVNFRLLWAVDARSATPGGIAAARGVDLYVVATTLLREVWTVVADLRVGSMSTRARSALGRRHAVGDLDGSRPRPGSGSAPSGTSLTGSDLGVFIGGFADTLPYRTSAAEARSLGSTSSIVAAVPADAQSPGQWSSLAAGLVLLIGSAHVHRLLKAVPTPRGDR